MANDYSLNAQVRSTLVRKNVDLSRVEHGVTNSVVYIRGTLRPYLQDVSSDLTAAKQEELQLVMRLERALRSLNGVRDVIFNLDRVVKVGWKWKLR